MADAFDQWQFACTYYAPTGLQGGGGRKYVTAGVSFECDIQPTSAGSRGTPSALELDNPYRGYCESTADTRAMKAGGKVTCNAGDYSGETFYIGGVEKFLNGDLPHVVLYLQDRELT